MAVQSELNPEVVLHAHAGTGYGFSTIDRLRYLRGIFGVNFLHTLAFGWTVWFLGIGIRGRFGVHDKRENRLYRVKFQYRDTDARPEHGWSGRRGCFGDYPQKQIRSHQARERHWDADQCFGRLIGSAVLAIRKFRITEPFS